MAIDASEIKKEPVYDQILDMIFGGRFAPGDKLVEETLANELGVSRVPVRETLAKLVGQGLLIGGGRGQGVRMRDYTVEDIRQLYEYREVLEGVAAAAAARVATSTDLARMEMICERAQKELELPDSKEWPNLDHHFHTALAEASHNSRVYHQLKLLVTECRYLFFVFPHPSHVMDLKRSPKEAGAYLQGIQQDHVELLELIRARKPEQAEEKARSDMRKSAERLSRWMIAGSLGMGRGGPPG